MTQLENPDRKPLEGVVVKRGYDRKPSRLPAVAAKTGKAAAATPKHMVFGLSFTRRCAAGLKRYLVAAEFEASKQAKLEKVLEERARRQKGAAVVALILAVVLLVYGRLYWPWLVAAFVVWLLLAGIAERLVRRSYEVESDANAGIGKHPGSKAVRAALAKAKLGKLEEVRVVGPVTRDTDAKAWTCVAELGVTAQQALKKQDELAAAFGVGRPQLSIDPVRNNNARVVVWCADSDPLAGKSLPSPLVGRTHPFNVFTEKVNVGYDVRGRQVGFMLPERSILTGGEPGSGKSVGSNNVLGACALDPLMPLILVDGKGGADLSAYEDIAIKFLAEPDPRALMELIDEVLADMKERYAKLKAMDEEKLTADVAEQVGFYQALVHIDELQFFMADKKWGEPIAKGLWDLTSRGRASGYTLSAATQRPSGDVVPTYLRDIISIRWALSCTTPEASNTVLGNGWAGKGYNAAIIDQEEQKGGGYLKSGATPILMRTGMLEKTQVKAVVRQAYKLREAAGTLPKSDSRPIVRLLKRMIAACGETDFVWTAPLLDVLLEREEHAGWDAAKLAGEVRPYGLSPQQINAEGSNRNGYRKADIERALGRA